MQYFTTTSKASRRACDCVIVGIYDRGKLGAGAADIDAASKGLIKRLIKSGDLSSARGQCRILHDVAGVRAKRVAVVGLGAASSFRAKHFTAATTLALRSLTSTRSRQVLNTLTLEPIKDTSAYYLGRFTAQAGAEALYRFSATKGGRKPKAAALASIGMTLATRGDANKAKRGAEHGDGIAHGMNLARELGNLPANVCTPSYIAREAQKIARKYAKVTCKIINEPEMKRLGMHSLLSVTAGTVQPAKFIVLQYKGATGKPVVLIGKGVTFDTGGNSLKPPAGMDEMKFDMCGASGVLGTFLTAAKLKLPVNLKVLIPAVENLPGGNATKPGDVVTSMSGQTIEILNTDAEGRLILCDAMTYARRFKPDVMIDVATLTGACVIALGHHHTGVMGNSDTLSSTLVSAGVRAEDRGWPLPLGEEYERTLKSNFADMANIGTREAGTIIAGCFLSKFADGIDWAHLDIAGTAWTSGKAKGASGRPVPMLTEFLLERAGQLP
ncbi:MAG: leucyl aminopeptidase [Pseudomonadota bacterium]